MTEHLPRRPASERYKEIMGLAIEATERMRQYDQQRAEDLKAAVAEAGDRLAQAAERERLMKMGVEARWEAAIAALWHERWLSIGQLPKPRKPTANLDPEQAEEALERTQAALEEALKNRPLFRLRQHDQD